MPKFSNAKTIINVDGETIAETDLAVYINFGNVLDWVPKQFLEDWPDKGNLGEVLIEKWIAIEKGIV